jgi:hypothetical protein
MDAIGLHHLRHPTDALEEKRHQRHLFLAGQFSYTWAKAVV